MTDANLSAQDDPRWHAFTKSGLKCSCGETHTGLFPINMLVPAGWQGSKTYEPDDALRIDGTFISENFCVFDGKAFAIRMRMPIRIRGAEPAAFTFTVWGAVNRQQFEDYVAARKAGTLRDGAQAQATLVNRLAGYDDTHNLTGVCFQQGDGHPPFLLIVGPQPYNKADHKLITDQKDGINFTQALELFATYGHDMRASAASVN